VAWNGANYLVVWRDGGNTLRGTRVNPATGALLDPADLALFTGAGISPYSPDVTSNGASWLVSWTDFRTAAPGIYAGRVSAAGVSLDPTGFLLAPGPNKDAPQSAFGAGNYIVIWTEYHTGTSFNDLYAVRLSGAGAVLDATPIAITTGGSNRLQSSQYGVVYLAPSFMIVYDISGIIYRARVTPATGAIVDVGVALTTACCAYAPTIARDGSTALVLYAAQVGNDYAIRGTRITSTGTDLDATDFSVATGTGISYEGPVLAGSSEGAMLAFSRYVPTAGVTSQRVRIQQVSSVPVFPQLEPPDSR
jgi:hypothetical protein